MESRINILSDKSVQFKAWLDCIVDNKGADSTLIIGQIYRMLAFLDRMEKEMDEIILKVFGESGE